MKEIGDITEKKSSGGDDWAVNEGGIFQQEDD